MTSGNSTTMSATTMMGLRWEKLSPEEFQQLQDLASYSSKKLKSVMEELHSEDSARYHPDAEVDYEGFKHFANTYLEVETPDELCRHLFLSFIKKTPKGLRDDDEDNEEHRLPISASPIGSHHSGSNLEGKVIKEMAMSSSTTAVAAISPQNAGSLSSLVMGNNNSTTASSSHHGGGGGGGGGIGIVEKLHEITEKFHHLLDNAAGTGSGTGGDYHHHHHHGRNSKKGGAVDRDSSCSSAGSATPAMSRAHTTSSLSAPHHSFSTTFTCAEIDINLVTVPLKDVVCYLSLLEGGRPEDKLEFMFRLYDSDSNGVLDTWELDCIVNQMMNVAEYLGWDVSELKPILKDMMIEIDYDADGTVSLEEWKRGGLTTVPLLVLLGLDQNVKEDGNHLWKLKHFNRPAYCNLCLTMLVGVGKKGLCCVLCKFTVHERCVQRAPASCIMTYVKSKKTSQLMTHHWTEGNCHGKCSKCKKTIKSYNGITGLHCRWCQMTLHNNCASQVKAECTLGELRTHILPPTSIYPVVLDRQRSFTNTSVGRSSSVSSGTHPPSSKAGSADSGNSTGHENGGSSTPPTTVDEDPFSPSATSGPLSFQITPNDNTKPLLVFINPKSGGQQGPKLMRKFQYLLNPRQVYDITNCGSGGPTGPLQMFKDVPNTRVICGGGDGTVGWVLDSMDKIKYQSTTKPPVGVIPLGTGNDLARCLKWGGGYEGESIKKILKKIEKSTQLMMDRWEITLSDVEKDTALGDPMPYNIINNYFSVGVDAAICVRFHLEREKNPHKFNSRMRNKMWYFEFGMSEQFSSSCKNLHQELEIECDGVSLELNQGPALQGLALLNIPYTHGGTNMWGEHLSRKRAKRKPKKNNQDQIDEDSNSCGSPTANLSTALQDIGDGLIEVIGLEDCFHMGSVRTGLRSSGRRLAQCSSVVIRTKTRFPMQIDGEPWMQPPCTIRVTHKNQVPMLMGPSSSGVFSFFKF